MGELTVQEPPLYRLHIHTACSDREATFRHCLEHEVVGMGWGVENDRALDWPAYCRLAEEHYGELNPSVRALHEMPEGALAWLRDTRGVYYLARVTGPWRYDYVEAAGRHDVHNVRPARIVACGVESLVPGKVLNAFIPQRTLQAINDEPAGRYSAALFAQLTGQGVPWNPSYEELLTSFLSARDLEDLVAVYLQQQMGYIALPAARRPDTPAYEYVLRHPDGHQAVAQVKSGWSEVPRDAASLPVDAVERIYVFSPTDSYGPDPAPNVQAIPAADLIDFLRAPDSCLPPLVEQWTGLVPTGA